MLRCVSVYPEKTGLGMKKKIEDYLTLAKQYHVDEVFSSIHLPEFTLKEQIDFLSDVATISKNLEMKLTADIGGNFICEALENKEIMNQLKEFDIAYLRLDCGYDFDQIRELYKQLDLEGFVINASMMDEKEVHQHLQFFYSLDPNISIRACHNFYV